jgi:predicted amidohydrolase YtcJ
VDSHIHFIDGGLGLLQTSFFNVNTRKELDDKINATRNELLDGMYIGRDLGNEPLTGIEMPIQMLDELLPEVPAIIFMKSGHAAIANTAALKKLGFRNTTTIADGTLQKNEQGSLTGLLLEGAAMEASRMVSTRYTIQTIERAILKVQALALSYGITTVGDNTFNPYFYKTYQELQKNDLLKMRIRARSYGRMPQTESLMQGVGKKHLGFIGGGVDPDRVNYHAMKFFEDESLAPTRHNHEAVSPGGKVFLDKKDLKDIFQLHPASTFAFHVQGKQGIQTILDAVSENSMDANNRRHILDHAGYTSAEQMQTAHKLGLGVTILASQLFDYKGIASYYKSNAATKEALEEDDLLNARMKHRVANGALTSDYPYGMDTLFIQYPQIDGLNPYPIMAVNTTGMYPDGTPIAGAENKTLTREEAIKAFTMNGAYVLHEEKRLGAISTGHFADFVILQDDILNGAPFDLYAEKVLKTYINGDLVYDANQTFLTDQKEKVNVSPSDYAISPVIGYDPTLGMILGGAYFRFPLKTPGAYFDFQLQAIKGGKLNLLSTYTFYDLFKRTDFNISGSYSNFFQYYFGEGNQTNAENYVKLYSNIYRLKPELTRKLKNKFQVSVFADWRGRHEIKVTDKNDAELGNTYFPDESTIALGISLKHDSRDNAFSTRKGSMQQVSLQHIPAAWNLNGSAAVTQINADIRFFQYVGNSNFVLATRFAAGYSIGSPGYLFRYTLGGSYVLRGYYSNRFRGEKYYAAQLEARFPIYKRFSGVAFTDAGDITDTDFGKTKFSYGAGIRFALSQNIKLRLDYGKATDQSGVFFTFSEAF